MGIRSVQKNVGDMQGTLFSIGGRMEELVSDGRSEKITSQLAELALQRRVMELEVGIASPANGGDTSGKIQGPPGVSNVLSSSIAGLRSDVQSLQGNMFAIGNRID